MTEVKERPSVGERGVVRKSFYCTCGFATTLAISGANAEAKIEQLLRIMHPMYGSEGHEPCNAVTARRARSEGEKEEA